MTSKGHKSVNGKDPVERTLGALDGLERAEAGDRFYARLEARLNEASSGGSLEQPSFFRWAAAAVLLLLVINILSLLKLENTAATAEPDREEGVEMMIRDYALDQPVIFTLSEEE